MIWAIIAFTVISWFTPILSVMPSAFTYSLDGTKAKNVSFGFIVMYFIIMTVRSVAFCGVWGSVLMNLVCLIAYLVPMLIFYRSNINPMWKLAVTEIVYFIVTNFYSWVVMPEYTKDLAGLFSCYLMALPFFGRSLISCFGFYGLFVELQKIRIKNYGMSVSS